MGAYAQNIDIKSEEIKQDEQKITFMNTDKANTKLEKILSSFSANFLINPDQNVAISAFMDDMIKFGQKYNELYNPIVSDELVKYTEAKYKHIISYVTAFCDHVQSLMLSNVLGVDVDEIQPEEDINTIPKLEIIQNKLITPQNSGKLII